MKLAAVAATAVGFVVGTSAYAADQDVIDTATAAGQFKTLSAALDAAGLVDTLRGVGPFTVFAPTDAAFAKLPAGTVETLLKPENEVQLKAVLTYHVVPGKMRVADVTKLTEAKTVNGAPVAIKVDGGNMMLNDAKVTATDIAASNGVIHVIDTVLMPPAN
ncbi:fasciclin domain-containing protein [Aquamicrobium soli]|uniref:Fasciclin domain-containing protein n=1 Tax=Aquamicrobium soli TaxID=1811518 RepID=A0ABV7K7E1_9HYPH